MVAVLPKPVVPRRVAPRKPLGAIQPEQPNPAESAQFMQAGNNARSQYLRSIAQNDYSRGQAGIGYQTGLRNLGFNQGLQRQAFDDPYIGRGVFNSGIRAQGLVNQGVSNYNQFLDLQQNYANQMGQYGLNDLQARSTQDQAVRNAQYAEDARRIQLAAQIAKVR